MERLAGARELLDGRLDDPAALAGNLRDLRRINRLGGGTRLSRRALERLIQSTVPGEGGILRLLDVGTGAADIPAALVRHWRERVPGLEVVAVDSRSEVLAAAIAIDPALEMESRLRLEVAEGTALPYPDASFDVAHASMVLHHLEPEDAVSLLEEMRRVSRIGVIVNDLARGRPHWLLAWLVLHLTTRNRLTRHDGPMSVRRSYTPREASDLLQRAGLRRVHLEHGPLRHRWAIAAVPR
jgi:ubiquinone/menaquinone biosynthesis C-methylase UbiE